MIMIERHRIGSYMRTIKIMIAASEEMHEEKLEFTNLIEHLNEVLEPRGIELKRVKWNPETDGAIENFKAKLKDCEMCLTLYWRELAGSSEQELDTAYSELKGGNNPRNLYVFFKEPTEGLTEALRDFKANFVTNYGHFFCKFENVDTMNLHFILQFEAYQNRLQGNADKLVKVAGGKVFVADKNFVNLDNVPFAALNKEYQRLQKELFELDIQVTEVRKRHKADPDNEDIEDELMAIKSKRKKLADEFEKYQAHLYDIALNFAKTAGEKYSERMRKARELFELGDTIGADQILNMEEMKRDRQRESEQKNVHEENLKILMNEFLDKTKTVMTNTLFSIPERFNIACEAYEEAKSIAEEIQYEDEKICNILFNYAFLLQEFNKLEKASTLYEEILSICQKHKNDANLTFKIFFADVAGNIASIFRDCGLLYKSYEKYKDSLNVYNELAREAAEKFLPEVARIQSSLGALVSDMGKNGDAIDYYIGALNIYTDINKTQANKYLPDIARTLDLLASAYANCREYGKAEKLYSEAYEIRHNLAEINPNEYLPEEVNSIYNLGCNYFCMKRFEEAEGNTKIALDYYRMFAKQFPDKYNEYVALGLRLLSAIQTERCAYNDSEDGYVEAWNIYKELINDNPNKYFLDVVKTLQGLARLQVHLKHYSLAIDAIKNALLFYQNFLQRQFNAFSPNLIQLKQELAKMLDYSGSFQEAVDNWNEVLFHYEESSKENEDFLPDKAITMYNLAIALWHNKQYKDAETNFIDAWKIFRKLAKNEPEKYEHYVYHTLNNLAAMNRSRNSLWRFAIYIRKKILTPVFNMFNNERHN